MIEQGISRLVQGDFAVSAIATKGGGYADELPKDLGLPSWTYRIVSHSRDYTLAGEGTNKITLDIECYGEAAADAIRLANAIRNVLDAFHGTLPDSDATQVDSCLLHDVDTYFDSDRRTWRRRLEYSIWFY